MINPFALSQFSKYLAWNTQVNLAQFTSLTSKIHQKYNFGQRHEKIIFIHYKQQI
jgi:hypothetical protein